MLQYEVARRIYNEMKEKSEKLSNGSFKEIYWYFIFCTLIYANTLTIWSQMDPDEQQSYQEKREEEYLEYAVELHNVCFDLNMNVLDDILEDKDAQSDFACYVQLFISLGKSFECF